MCVRCAHLLHLSEYCKSSSARTKGRVICCCCRQGLGFRRRCVCEASWVKIDGVPAGEFAVDQYIMLCVKQWISATGNKQLQCCLEDSASAQSDTAGTVPLEHRFKNMARHKQYSWRSGFTALARQKQNDAWGKMILLQCRVTAIDGYERQHQDCACSRNTTIRCRLAAIGEAAWLARGGWGGSHQAG